MGARASRVRAGWRIATAFVVVGAIVACSVGDEPLAEIDTGPTDAGNDGSPADAQPGDGSAGSADGGADTGVVDAGLCDLDADFKDPTTVPGLQGLGSVARFSANEMMAYYVPLHDAAGPDQLAVATRSSPTGTFGGEMFLGDVNDSSGETTPWLGTDGGTLFYGHGDALIGGGAARDIYSATPSDGGRFDNGSSVPNVNAPNAEDDYVSQASNQDLWFSSNRDGGDLAVWHSSFVQGQYNTPEPVAGFSFSSTSAFAVYPVLTPDLLEIYVERLHMKSDADAGDEIWRAKRTNPEGPFPSPMRVEVGLTSSQGLRPTWISPDGCRLYIGVGTPIDMYVASRPLR